MDEQIDTDGDFLKRTMALLFSLANLCAGVADRSWPVRCFVLWVLRPAEQIAWGHIPEHVVAPFVEGKLYSRYHALYFAWLFKTAAYWLKRRLRQEARFARRLARPRDESPGDRVPAPGATLRNQEASRRVVPGICRLLPPRELFVAPVPQLDSS